LSNVSTTVFDRDLSSDDVSLFSMYLFGTRDPFFCRRFVKPACSHTATGTLLGQATTLVAPGILDLILRFCWEAILTSWLEEQTSNNRMNYENR